MENIPEITPSRNGYHKELIEKVYLSNPEAKMQRDRMVNFINDNSFYLEKIQKSIAQWNARQQVDEGNPSGELEVIDGVNGKLTIKHYPSGDSVRFFFAPKE